jgi:hypothetical protein
MDVMHSRSEDASEKKNQRKKTRQTNWRRKKSLGGMTHDEKRRGVVTRSEVGMRASEKKMKKMKTVKQERSWKEKRTERQWVQHECSKRRASRVVCVVDEKLP